MTKRHQCTYAVILIATSVFVTTLCDTCLLQYQYRYYCLCVLNVLLFRISHYIITDLHPHKSLKNRRLFVKSHKVNSDVAHIKERKNVEAMIYLYKCMLLCGRRTIGIKC